MTSLIHWSLRKLKRLLIAVIGFTVLAMGVAMIVLPGPALVVLPLGLAILATEFVWARMLLKKVRARLPFNRGTTKNGPAENGPT